METKEQAPITNKPLQHTITSQNYSFTEQKNNQSEQPSAVSLMNYQSTKQPSNVFIYIYAVSHFTKNTCIEPRILHQR